MIQIKKTKNVEMLGDRDNLMIKILDQGVIVVSMKNIFQVKRGLESYTQRFYRKHLKK